MFRVYLEGILKAVAILKSCRYQNPNEDPFSDTCNSTYITCSYYAPGPSEHTFSPTLQVLSLVLRPKPYWVKGGEFGCRERSAELEYEPNVS